MVAVLGGLDTFVFTGGIGENAAEVRARVMARLEHLGIVMDLEANSQNAALVSSAASSVSVRVIPTDESLMIARHVRALLLGK
jgi:acetate kinase